MDLVQEQEQPALGLVGTPRDVLGAHGVELGQGPHRREIELIMLVRQLLYTEKYTIDGARQKIDEYKKNGELRSVARAALDMQTVESLESDLRAMSAILDGEDVPE